MRLGVCIDRRPEADAFASVADFVEIPGRELVAATPAQARRWVQSMAAFPSAPVCNRLLPYGITLYDTPADRRALDAYWATLLQRGGELGVSGYCLGAAAARAVDDAPGRDATISGIRRVIANLAQRTADAGATLYLEPLRPAECRWLNRAADCRGIAADGVLGLCADIVHLAAEVTGGDWPAACSWARSAHCHLSGPEHGSLTGHEQEAAEFVAAVARGTHIDGVSLEHFSGTIAERCTELDRLRDACRL